MIPGRELAQYQQLFDDPEEETERCPECDGEEIGEDGATCVLCLGLGYLTKDAE